MRSRRGFVRKSDPCTVVTTLHGSLGRALKALGAHFGEQNSKDGCSMLAGLEESHCQKMSKISLEGIGEGEAKFTKRTVNPVLQINVKLHLILFMNGKDLP